MISGLSNYAVAKDNEPGARVYVLANTKQQAGELFDESRAMVQKSPFFGSIYVKIRKAFSMIKHILKLNLVHLTVRS